MKKTLFKALTLVIAGEKPRWLKGLPKYDLMGGNTIINCLETADNIVPIDVETLCQYIGKQDKNGADIFEGDNLRFVHKLGNRTVAEILTVYYDEGTAGYMLGKNGCGLPVAMFNVADSEIVGNENDIKIVNP